MPFLGHEVIAGEGATTDKSKCRAMFALRPPSTSGDLASFLGAAVFYAKFIPDFAAVASPLRQLARTYKSKMTPLQGNGRWTKVHQKAFDALKAALCFAPVLAFPKFDRPWVLLTDASYGQISAILCQVSDDGVERPVQYASRCLTDTEKRYGITDKEALAVVFGANKFRHFIASSPVVVCTDHSALKLLKTKTVFPSDRLARYALALSDLDLHIVHRPGRVLNLPDAVSRIEVEDDAELAEQMLNDVTNEHMERALQRAGMPTKGSAGSQEVFRKLICHPRCDIESDSDYDSNDLEDERHPGRRFSPQHTR